jgi:predicted secreted protein
VTWISYLAIYFLIWWVTLFAIIPFSLRTQDEDQEVTLGTTASAPKGSHMRRAALRTTIVSALIFAALWFVTVRLGLGIDDIPRIAPRID